MSTMQWMNFPLNGLERCYSLKNNSPPPIGIFWDIENCTPPPEKFRALVFVMKIRNKFSQLYREAEFLVVCDVHNQKKKTIDELNHSMVTVAHVSSFNKNAADDKLKQSIRKFADTYKTPAAIVLISGDINFASELADLRFRNSFYVILIHNKQTNASLTSFPNECHLFENFFTQESSGHEMFSSFFMASQQPVRAYVSMENLPLTWNRKALLLLQSLLSQVKARLVSLKHHTAILQLPDIHHAIRARSRFNNLLFYGHRLRVRLLDEALHEALMGQQRRLLHSLSKQPLKETLSALTVSASTGDCTASNHSVTKETAQLDDVTKLPVKIALERPVSDAGKTPLESGNVFKVSKKLPAAMESEVKEQVVEGEGDEKELKCGMKAEACVDKVEGKSKEAQVESEQQKRRTAVEGDGVSASACEVQVKTPSSTPPTTSKDTTTLADSDLTIALRNLIRRYRATKQAQGMSARKQHYSIQHSTNIQQHHQHQQKHQQQQQQQQYQQPQQLYQLSEQQRSTTDSQLATINLPHSNNNNNNNNNRNSLDNNNNFNYENCNNNISDKYTPAQCDTPFKDKHCSLLRNSRTPDLFNEEFRRTPGAKRPDFNNRSVFASINNNKNNNKNKNNKINHKNEVLSRDSIASQLPSQPRLLFSPRPRKNNNNNNNHSKNEINCNSSNNNNINSSNNNNINSSNNNNINSRNNAKSFQAGEQTLTETCFPPQRLPAPPFLLPAKPTSLTFNNANDVPLQQPHHIVFHSNNYTNNKNFSNNDYQTNTSSYSINNNINYNIKENINNYSNNDSVYSNNNVISNVRNDSVIRNISNSNGVNNSSNNGVNNSSNNGVNNSSAETPVELEVSNLDFSISPNEWNKIFATQFKKLQVRSIAIHEQADSSKVVRVVVSSQHDADILFNCFNHKKIGYKRILITRVTRDSSPTARIATPCAPPTAVSLPHPSRVFPVQNDNTLQQCPSNSTKSNVVSLLKSLPGNKLPLFQFLNLYQKRYNSNLSSLDVQNLRQTVELFVQRGVGKMIRLNPSYYQTSFEQNSSCTARDSFNSFTNISYDVDQTEWRPSEKNRASIDSCKQPLDCHLACRLSNKQAGRQPFMSVQDGGPRIRIKLKNLSTQLYEMLQRHRGRLLFECFPHCYASFYGASSLLVDKDYGVPLEHLITCVPGIQLSVTPSGKQIHWSSVELKVFQQLTQQQQLLMEDLIELLVSSASSCVPLSKLACYFEEYFARPLVVSNYGCSDLMQLVSLMSRHLQLMGVPPCCVVTLTQETQIKRLSCTLEALLQRVPFQRLCLTDVPETYAKLTGFSFEIWRYGVVQLEDVIRQLPGSIFTVFRNRGVQCLSLKRPDAINFNPHDNTFDNNSKRHNNDQEGSEIGANTSNGEKSDQGNVSSSNNYNKNDCSKDLLHNVLLLMMEFSDDQDSFSLHNLNSLLHFCFGQQVDELWLLSHSKFFEVKDHSVEDKLVFLKGAMIFSKRARDLLLLQHPPSLPLHLFPAAFKQHFQLSHFPQPSDYGFNSILSLLSGADEVLLLNHSYMNIALHSKFAYRLDKLLEQKVISNGRPARVVTSTPGKDAVWPPDLGKCFAECDQSAFFSHLKTSQHDERSKPFSQSLTTRLSNENDGVAPKEEVVESYLTPPVIKSLFRNHQDDAAMNSHLGRLSSFDYRDTSASQQLHESTPASQSPFLSPQPLSSSVSKDNDLSSLQAKLESFHLSTSPPTSQIFETPLCFKKRSRVVAMFGRTSHPDE